MKRRIFFGAATMAVAAGAVLAVGGNVEALIEKLPLQSVDEVDFAFDAAPEILTAPFAAHRPGSETVRIATATPFDGSASPRNAAEALDVLARAHSRIAEAARVPLAPMAGDGLSVAAASKAFAPEGETASAEPVDVAPKPLATRLFDDDTPGWRSEYFTDNPLTGAILKADGSPSDPAALMGAARAARYVLLGEIHNNPDHHRLQAGIIDDLARAGANPAVVFEMIPERLAGTLKAAEATGAQQTLAALARSLEWTERGWPDFSIYEPIFETALENGLGLAAGDLDREVIRDISATGGAALSAEERAVLGLDIPLSEDESADLSQELKAAHCGLLPDVALAPMQNVQRARDGAMARAMAGAAAEHGSAVLIAGGGHVRTDRGVPVALKRIDPDGRSVAVQMIEVASADESEVADYGLSAESPAPYDFTIVTPRADLTDHCAALRRSMEGRSGGNGVEAAQ